MDEELLINLVRQHGELYDTAHKQYDDQLRREAAWEEIAKQMNQTAHDCKERWKRLRDNYRKARKLRQTKKAQGLKKIKPIKYEKIISFINDVIDSREKERGAEQEEEDDSESSSSNAENPFVEFTEHQEPPGETTEQNTVVNFFANLGETVKTFPPEVQVRVKRDIFRIINEAEEEVLANRFNNRRAKRVKRISDVSVKYESPDYDYD